MADSFPKTRSSAALYGVALALVLGVCAWVRWPGFTQGGFASHDVAGILYNGMLLDQGLFPYADSIEFKAPGTFYLAWWLAEGGRSIARFQIWANGWALASVAAVAAIAWRQWTPRAAVAAAVLYALHDAHLDTMDANYVTWAQLPSIIAVGWALEARRRTTSRASSRASSRAAIIGFVIAGSAAAAALVLKRPAGVALLLVLGLAVVARPGTLATPIRRIQSAAAVLVGAGIVLGSLALHYAAGGQLQALWDGFILSKWGWTYAVAGTELLADTAPREGLFATVYFLPLPLALAGYSLASAPDPEARSTARVLAAWAALALLAASVGFRFYKGYFLAVVPPLALLGAAPWGLLGPARGRTRWTRAFALLPALLLAGRQALLVHHERVNRARPHDLGGRAIAKHVRRQTTPDERIWVWGWHLWDVYPMTGRLAGTRFYKTMELTTSPNDATWRQPRSRLTFRDGPAAEAVVAELRENRPKYIVLGSAVPARQFKELGQVLRDHYKRDRTARLNRVQFWIRRYPLPGE